MQCQVDQDVGASDDENTESEDEYQAAARKRQASQPGPLEECSDEDTDLDNDGLLIQKAHEELRRKPVKRIAPAPSFPQPSAKASKVAEKRPRATRPGGGVTLKRLIDKGFLVPGEGNLRCEYKGMISVGTLTPDGRITWEGQTFESPSAWSIHLKRLVTPNRKADDGWKTIKYEGKYLEHYKVALAHEMFGSQLSDKDAASLVTQAFSLGRKPSPTCMTGLPAVLPEVEVAASNGTKVVKNEFVKKEPRSPLKKPPPVAKKPSSAPSADQRQVSNGRSRGGETSTTAPTKYAMQRPKREVKPPKHYMLDLSVGDDHLMVPCTPYEGKPGSGSVDSQPFTIEITARAQFVMDLHGHLDTCEVIGLLGGSHDEERHHIRVERAYPVNEVETDDNRINVEMDSEDQVRVCSRIEADGLQCVGWYHSHPDFPAIPSVVDIENQARYQEINRRADTGDEPYIAAIIGPYLKSLQTSVSSIEWFYVSHPAGKRLEFGKQPLEQGYEPRSLKVSLDRSEQQFDKDLMSDIQEVVNRYAVKFRSRVEMYSMWRDNTSNLDKLQASLEARVPQSWTSAARKTYAGKVVGMVRDGWYPPEEIKTESDSDMEARYLNGSRANGSGGDDDSETESEETR